MLKCFLGLFRLVFFMGILLSGDLLVIASGCRHFLVVAVYSEWVAVDSWLILIAGGVL